MSCTNRKIKVKDSSEVAEHTKIEDKGSPDTMTHDNDHFYYCSYDGRRNMGNMGGERLGDNWTGNGDNEWRGWMV